PGRLRVWPCGFCSCASPCPLGESGPCVRPSAGWGTDLGATWEAGEGQRTERSLEHAAVRRRVAATEGAGAPERVPAAEAGRPALVDAVAMADQDSPARAC